MQQYNELNIKYNQLLTLLQQNEKAKKKEASLQIQIKNALVVIVCIGKYQRPNQDLNGTEKDKSKLISLFDRKLKYDIICNKNNDVAAPDMEILLERSRTRFKEGNYDGLMVFFSGHGNQDSLILSDCTKEPRCAFESYFNGGKVKSKAKAHKFYFVDACRGSKNSNVIDCKPKNKNKEAIAKGDNVFEDENNLIHPEENRCIMYPNTNNYVSYQIPLREKSQNNDEKKMEIMNQNNLEKRNKSPFGGVLLNAFYETVNKHCDNAFAMNFAEMQDSIRDNAEKRKVWIKKHDEWEQCRSKIDESSNLRNRDKARIIFKPNDYKDRERINARNMSLEPNANIQYF